MPMVERLIDKKLYKNYDLIKTLGGIDRTLHMGKLEKQTYITIVEDEKLLLVSARFLFYINGNNERCIMFSKRS